jgi:hypothetical protein
MADRVVGFISPEHAAQIDWKEEMDVEDAPDADEEEESDRLFTFEVAKTNEQEENVTCRRGFPVSLHFFACSIYSRIRHLKDA